MGNEPREIIIAIERIARDVRRIADKLDQGAPEAIRPNQAYSRQQAGQLLNVGTWTIDKARKAGSLVETERIGHRDVRITGTSLLRFHRERAGTARATVRRL